MMIKRIKNIEFEAVQGDIANQPDIEAVVNAANAQLRTGGGVAGALHQAAGPQLAEEGQKSAPINPGEAVITKAYDLPNEYMIHCLGPVFGRDKPEAELLAKCYKNAIDLAEKNNIASIAFPAISTGAFGYPVEEATNIAVKSILDKVEGLRQLQKIKFVLYNQADLKLYEDKLNDLPG